MSRELNMDTQRQNFWKEAIDKETFLRLTWHLKYEPDIKKRHTLTAEEKEAARIARVEKFTAMVPKLQPGARVLPVIKYPKKSKPRFQLATKQTSFEKTGSTKLRAEMRPVSPGVRTQLYEGFTKEGKGRYQYLHTRTLKKPEDKYEFPLTTSWEYGWRLGDVITEFRSPQYGRSRIVRDTFFRKNGILYDPITA